MNSNPCRSVLGADAAAAAARQLSSEVSEVYLPTLIGCLLAIEIALKGLLNVAIMCPSLAAEEFLLLTVPKIPVKQLKSCDVFNK